MRSKKTSRYRAAHDHDEDEASEAKVTTVGNLALMESVHLLFVERASELLLLYLDKHDRDKLSRGTSFSLTLSVRALALLRRLLHPLLDHPPLHQGSRP